jgi:hexosaminidase
MKQIRIYIMIVFLSLFNSCIQKNTRNSGNIAIIPKPVSVKVLSGNFLLSDNTVIVYDEGLKNTGYYLSEQIVTVTGLKLPIKQYTKTGENSIYLKFDNKIKDNEGYRLEITNKITITARKKAGIFYGIQSLLQLAANNSFKKNRNIELPEVVIDDHPEFRWRGMHLDVSRHFFTKNEIKEYIDILALHKLNIFHWHLTDDQGWRIEIKKYPKLTSIGAWREDRRYEIWNITDEQRVEYNTSKPFYGGYYTQEDVKEIVEYAQERNITIIPEIEMPGHSCAALVAYPEYSCFGYETEVPSGGFVAEDWDFSDPYCAGNDKTFEFLQDILDEVITLFPSEYIHIGGDECSKKRWKQCPKCQARMKNKGLKDEAELQSYFIRRMEKYLNSKGRKIIGWEEILEGGIDPSATIMPWKTESATQVCTKAADEGHDVIMVPSEYLYFNTQWPGERKIHQNSLELGKVYSLNPIPKNLGIKESDAIMGIEACAWSEYMITFDDVLHQTLPRMAALAEIAWINPLTKNIDDFRSRLDIMKSLYTAYGLHYHVQVPLGINDKTVFTDKVVVQITPPSNDLILHYTTDGTEPTLKSAVFDKNLILTKTTTLKVTSFDKYGQCSLIKTALFEKQDFNQADNVKADKKGVRYRFINGKFRSAEDVNGVASKSGILDKIMTVEAQREEGFGMIFNGYIDAPEKGLYTFYLLSGDGSILKIGGKTVVNNNGFHDDSQEISGQIALDKGLHHFTLKYFKWNKGDGSVKLYVKYPGSEKQETGNDFFRIINTDQTKVQFKRRELAGE